LSILRTQLREESEITRVQKHSFKEKFLSLNQKVEEYLGRRGTADADIHAERQEKGKLLKSSTRLQWQVSKKEDRIERLKRSKESLKTRLDTTKDALAIEQEKVTDLVKEVSRLVSLVVTKKESSPPKRGAESPSLPSGTGKGSQDGHSDITEKKNRRGSAAQQDKVSLKAHKLLDAEIEEDDDDDDDDEDDEDDDDDDDYVPSRERPGKRKRSASTIRESTSKQRPKIKELNRNGAETTIKTDESRASKHSVPTVPKRLSTEESDRKPPPEHTANNESASDGKPNSGDEKVRRAKPGDAGWMNWLKSKYK